MDTRTLIASLVATAEPVRPLREPLLRALLWFAGAVGLLIGLAATRGLRPDLALQLASPTFLPMLLAMFATGASAAIAAFQLSLPDRSRWWAVLPLPAALLWLSFITFGCITSWIGLGPGDVTLARVLDCLLTVLIAGLPMSGALALMLRHAALLDAQSVATAAALAVAALTAASLSLLHPLDSTVMILVWNVGLAALACILAHRFGRTLLRLALSPGA